MGGKHGEIHWTELMTHDPEKAASFYREVLGWRIEEMEMGGAEPYRIASLGEAPLCGIFKMSGQEMAGAPDQWVTYFAVDDADAAAEAAAGAGGEIVSPPFDVPGVGRIAMAKDAVGALCGFMTPSERG